jgi:hypothetical protein
MMNLSLLSLEKFDTSIRKGFPASHLSDYYDKKKIDVVFPSKKHNIGQSNNFDIY